jgi:hypothetical protein
MVVYEIFGKNSVVYEIFGNKTMVFEIFAVLYIALEYQLTNAIILTRRFRRQYFVKGNACCHKKDHVTGMELRSTFRRVF